MLDNNKCPKCASTNTTKYGSYFRKADLKKILRYRCLSCNVTFSDNSYSLDYVLKKVAIATEIKNAYESGESIRAIARRLEIDRKMVTRKISSLGSRGCSK